MLKINQKFIYLHIYFYDVNMIIKYKSSRANIIKNK